MSLDKISCNCCRWWYANNFNFLTSTMSLVTPYSEPTSYDTLANQSHFLFYFTPKPSIGDDIPTIIPVLPHLCVDDHHVTTWADDVDNSLIVRTRGLEVVWATKDVSVYGWILHSTMQTWGWIIMLQFHVLHLLVTCCKLRSLNASSVHEGY